MNIGEACERCGFHGTLTVVPTSGQAAVGATQVDVDFGDGCHAQLVIGAGEKGSKCAGIHNVPLTSRTSHGNIDLGREHVS